jgi:hypothetical protein
MLRELDFIEGEWPAVLWTLGSSAALCRHSLWRYEKALSLKRIAKGMLAVLTGIAGSAAFLAICVAAFFGLLHTSWFDPVGQKFADRLLIVAVPESVYLACAIAMWRRKKTVALGILLSGVILITHAIIHFATHV